MGEGKGNSHISVNPFPWETCRSRLRLHRCRAGRTGQGQKDRDGNVATASSQQVRDRELNRRCHTEWLQRANGGP